MGIGLVIVAAILGAIYFFIRKAEAAPPVEPVPPPEPEIPPDAIPSPPSPVIPEPEPTPAPAPAPPPPSPVLPEPTLPAVLETGIHVVGGYAKYSNGGLIVTIGWYHHGKGYENSPPYYSRANAKFGSFGGYQGNWESPPKDGKLRISTINVPAAPLGVTTVNVWVTMHTEILVASSDFFTINVY